MTATSGTRTPTKGAEIVVFLKQFNEKTRIDEETEIKALFVSLKDSVLWVSLDGGVVGLPLHRVNEINFGVPLEKEVPID